MTGLCYHAAACPVLSLSLSQAIAAAYGYGYRDRLQLNVGSIRCSPILSTNGLRRGEPVGQACGGFPSRR